MKKVFLYLLAVAALFSLTHTDVDAQDVPRLQPQKISPFKINLQRDYMWRPDTTMVRPRLVDQGSLVIMVDKRLKTLALVYECSRDTLKCYNIGRVGLNPGPKQRAGDRKTPEGWYKVAGIWRDSRYYIWIATDYPNAVDRAAGYTGSGIGIHYLGPEHIRSGANPNGSKGCITFPDKDTVKEIADLIAVGTKIFIR